VGDTADEGLKKLILINNNIGKKRYEKSEKI
jgi:hypothetical protein